LVSNQLALQLFRALDHEMKSFVGLGSDDAVLLMDRAGGVHGSNRAARKLAEARFFVASASGGLALAERAHEKVFRAAFRQFCLDWPEEMRVLIDNHTLLVLRPGVESSAVVALVAVTIRQIQKRFVVPLDKLQAVLEVSPKQAEVAQAVMRGLGPVEYAQETGCSVKTARFHLYGLMRKVGCHSQIELGNFLSRTFG
jgi:DNA-binding CsgD family transcriptional regulator